MNQLRLTPEESLAFAQENSHWEGFVAGAQAAAAAAKQMAIQRIVNARKAAPAEVPPAVEPTV